MLSGRAIRSLNVLGGTLGCAALLLLASCREIDNGIDAFTQGRYNEAVATLRPIIRRFRDNPPRLEVALDRNSTLEAALPGVTRDWFGAWYAYAGSHFGTGQLDEGCRLTGEALRPIQIRVRQNGQTRDVRVDPARGDHWQMDVMTLRSWRLVFGCP